MGMVQLVLFVLFGFFPLFASDIANAMPSQKLSCVQIFSGLEALPGAEAVSQDFAATYGLLTSQSQVPEPNAQRRDNYFRFPNFPEAVRSLDAAVQKHLVAVGVLPDDVVLQEKVAVHIARLVEALGAHAQVIADGQGFRGPRVLILPDNDLEKSPWISRAATFLNSQTIPVALTLHGGGLDEDGQEKLVAELKMAPGASKAELTMEHLYATYPEGPGLSFDQVLYHNSQLQQRALAQEAWPVHFITVPAYFDKAEFAALRGRHFALEDIGANLHSAFTLMAIIENKQWFRLPPNTKSVDHARALAKNYAQEARLEAKLSFDLYTALLDGLNNGKVHIAEDTSKPDLELPNEQGIDLRIPVGNMQGDRHTLLRSQIEYGLKWITAYRNFLDSQSSLWQ